MKLEKLFVFLFLILSFGFSLISYADPTCSTCLLEVDQGEKTIRCKKGHSTHLECLNNQVEATGNIRSIKSNGLRCNGLCGPSSSSGTQCMEIHSFKDIRKALDSTEVEKLDKRLAEAEAPPAEQKSMGEVQRLTSGLDAAFNLCCPKEKCGSVLDKIEGCNAATCSNENCKARFCYLCLEQQKDNPSAHAHARNHSGNYWEIRKGYGNRNYTERYHGLIARAKLDELFQTVKKNSPDREAALNARKAMLAERHMWPMPAGISTVKWIQELNEAHFPKEKHIEMLQDEAIYLRKKRGLVSRMKEILSIKPKNASLIEAEIKRLHAPVLASLDISRPGPIVPGAIVPVMEDDGRVSRAFAHLGNMYQVGGLIWSGIPDQSMTYHGANRFCQGLAFGSRLPTADEFKALRRAMGYGRFGLGEYNPNLLPDTIGRTFWSSTDHPKWFELSYLFVGSSGDFTADGRLSHSASVRCVR